MQLIEIKQLENDCLIYLRFSVKAQEGEVKRFVGLDGFAVRT